MAIPVNPNALRIASLPFFWEGTTAGERSEAHRSSRRATEGGFRVRYPPYDNLTPDPAAIGGRAARRRAGGFRASRCPCRGRGCGRSGRGWRASVRPGVFRDAFLLHLLGELPGDHLLDRGGCDFFVNAFLPQEVA